MAIAQRQSPRYYTPAAPTVRPVPSRRRRPARSATVSMPKGLLSLVGYGIIALGFVVVYLYGCSQMAACSFDNSHLRDQLSEVEAQNHMLNGKLIEQNNRYAVDAWAAKNGMAHATTTFVVR